MEHTLFDIYNSLEDMGVCIFNCPLKSNVAVCSPDGFIGIDESKILTSTEKYTVLAHEEGHFTSGVFYLPYSPYVIREQAEYRATKSAIQKRIDLDELYNCFRNGITELWEIAEHFNVTEDFMFKAYLFYSDTNQFCNADIS